MRIALALTALVLFAAPAVADEVVSGGTVSEETVATTSSSDEGTAYGTTSGTGVVDSYQSTVPSYAPESARKGCGHGETAAAEPLIN